MNTFASIMPFVRYGKVTYYSLLIDGEEFCEADKFFNKAAEWTDSDVQLKVDRLRYWIEFLGERGIQQDQLRPERKAKALPPKDGKPPFNLSSGKNVRLYCYWVNERVIILFNGGLKTNNDPTKCPNVSDHFYNAVNWSGKFEKLNIQTSGQDIANLSQLKIRS